MPADEKKSTFSRAANAFRSRGDRPKRSFRGTVRSIKKWFREMKSELKKVIWPTPNQITKNTGVALAVMLVFAIVLWGFDSLAQAGVRALITLAG